MKKLFLASLAGALFPASLVTSARQSRDGTDARGCFRSPLWTATPSRFEWRAISSRSRTFPDTRCAVQTSRLISVEIGM